MYLQRNVETSSWIHCCRGKAKIVPDYESVFVALVSQRAKRISHIILPSLQCLAVTYFYTLLHRRHDFLKKVLNIKFYFHFLYNFVWNISHSKKNWARYNKHVYWSSCKVPIFLWDVSELEFSRNDFWKNSNIKFQENSSSGSRVAPYGWRRTYIQTDGQTDMAKLIVIFHNFANALKTKRSISVTSWGTKTALFSPVN